MKRIINKPFEYPLSTQIDSYIVTNKIIKTIESCKTIEQLKNTSKWFSWIYNCDKNIKYNTSINGIIYMFYRLLENKRKELENN